ncbi:MAG: LamG-like jellyroll fold domain-containing protein [Bacilli bacterium]
MGSKTMKYIMVYSVLIIVCLIGIRGRRDNYRDRYNPAPDVNAAEVYATLMESCVAHWPMDDNEPNTTVLDVVGGYNGIANKNTEDLYVTGTIDGAFEFNGESDFIDTNEAFKSTFANSFTINLWCKLNDGQPSAANYFFGLQDLVGNSVYFRCDTTGKLYSIYGAVGETAVVAGTGTAIFEDGLSEWTMLTVKINKISQDVASSFIYADGNLVKSNENANIALSSYNGELQLYIGALNIGFGSAGHLSGSLDNVMLFNKALSQTEITVLYEKEY